MIKQYAKSQLGQSKKHSLLESFLNVFVGYGIAVSSQYVIFPMFDIYVSLESHMLIGLFFTVVSIIRSYFLRRFFNYLHIRRIL